MPTVQVGVTVIRVPVAQIGSESAMVSFSIATGHVLVHALRTMIVQIIRPVSIVSGLPISAGMLFNVCALIIALVPRIFEAGFTQGFLSETRLGSSAALA